VLTAINFKHSKAELIRQKAAEAAKKGMGIVAMKTMAGAYIDHERTKPVNCSAALKWVMQDANFHTSIPGITSFDQMIHNFSIMNDLNLTEKEKADLDEARLVAGLYCDNCTRCIDQCKQRLPINEYMRAFMYAYGYQNYEKALSVMADDGKNLNPCQGCSKCEVICTKGFNVFNRISDVNRLMSVS
jgi:predicted aldo/keto reductase-like oxidoreductase